MKKKQQPINLYYLHLFFILSSESICFLINTIFNFCFSRFSPLTRPPRRRWKLQDAKPVIEHNAQFLFFPLRVRWQGRWDESDDCRMQKLVSERNAQFWLFPLRVHWQGRWDEGDDCRMQKPVSECNASISITLASRHSSQGRSHQKARRAIFL